MNKPNSSNPQAFGKFLELASAVVSVPKSEIDRREQEYRKEREEKKRKK